MASWNRRAFVYDQRTLKQQDLEFQHTGGVSAVDWSPDGQRLLTATVEGEVGIWDRESGRQMLSWPQDVPVVQAAFAMEGSRIVIARKDGKVRVREVFGGSKPGAEVPELMEQLSGYRVGSDGGLITIESPVE